jgi:hypothetical protein
MAGRGDAARGIDRASKIMKYDGLPGKGKPIVEDFNSRPSQIPVLGGFVSTMGADPVAVNPLSVTSAFGDVQAKPKFTAKITLFDEHSNDVF